MNKENFIDLYKKQDRDDSVTSFQNEVGFSLVRQYPDTSEFHNKPLRMFIKVAILETGLFYSVDMTKVEKEGEKTVYNIKDDDGSGNYTNFYSSKDSEFVFEKSSQKIKQIKKNREFTLNQFVDILEANHLSDLLFWKRKANWLAILILKSLFWLSDRRYDEVQTFVDAHIFSKGGKAVQKHEISFEPFFKYFYISKNFIFLLLIVTFFSTTLIALAPCYFPIQRVWTKLFGEFTLSNPFVVLLFFLTLFISEKISISLHKMINDFLVPDKNVLTEPKKSLIEKLHNYLHRNKVKIKV